MQGYRCKLLVSYLSEQSVVSGFTYADIPHHQHLNTKHMIRQRATYTQKNMCIIYIYIQKLLKAKKHFGTFTFMSK